MASPWCRLWADMPNDPKWRTIARASKQSIGNVVAVYIHLMTCASTQPNANERGQTHGWRDEDVANALDIEIEQVTQIMAAMEGRVIKDGYLTGWERRQSIREDEGAAERAKAFREREKAKKEAAELASRTLANASERKRTTEVEVEVEVEKKTPRKPSSPAVLVPEWVPLTSWEAYVAMRRCIKKPLTNEAVPLAIAKLEKLKAQGSHPKDVLDQSVLNSWQGLFEVKPQDSTAPKAKDWE